MATANGTPTDAWSLVKHVTSAEKGGVSCRYTDIEIAVTETATAPAATLEGHFVKKRHTEPVELSAGARLWWRIAPMNAATSEGGPVGIYTIS